MRRGKSKSERKTKEKGAENNEVEQMLRAAQDEILLNLSVNSHLARASPSSTNSDPVLDPDLERRFQALKMKNKVHQPVVEELDLSARFDALKAKFNPPVDPTLATVTASKSQSYYEEGESEEDEETQVQKLIEWAKDAARLDPSPPSPPSQSESDDDDDDDDPHHHHR